MRVGGRGKGVRVPLEANRGLFVEPKSGCVQPLSEDWYGYRPSCVRNFVRNVVKSRINPGRKRKFNIEEKATVTRSSEFRVSELEPRVKSSESLNSEPRLNLVRFKVKSFGLTSYVLGFGVQGFRVMGRRGATTLSRLLACPPYGC